MAKVAIIMRSKNEHPYVIQVLKGLSEQTFKDFELYNVDSGSNDGTLEYIQQANPKRLLRIRPEEYVPGKVLNEAIEKTEEPIIVLLNADAVPTDHLWLENLLKPILENRCDAALSRQIARSDAHYIVQSDYQRGYDPLRLSRTPLDIFSAVSCAFKRELWEKTRFYTTGYSEDLIWFHACQKKGARFSFVPASCVEHSHNYSLKGLYRKRYRHGRAFASQEGFRLPLWKAIASCLKEMARDTLQALKSGKIHTTPYNLIYRGTIYLAYYQGVKSIYNNK